MKRIIISFICIFTIVMQTVAQSEQVTQFNKGSLGLKIGLSTPIGVFSDKKIGGATNSEPRQGYAKNGLSYQILYITPYFGKNKKWACTINLAASTHNFNDISLRNEFSKPYPQGDISTHTSILPFDLIMQNNKYRHYSAAVGILYSIKIYKQLSLQPALSMGIISSKMPDYKLDMSINRNYGQNFSQLTVSNYHVTSLSNKGLGWLIEVPINLKYQFQSLPISINFGICYTSGFLNIKSTYTENSYWQEYQYQQLVSSGSLNMQTYTQKGYNYLILNYQTGISYNFK